MINVKTLVVGGLCVNCYAVTSDNSTDAVLIDPGDDVERVKAFLVKHNLTPKVILLTHGHFDHCNGVKALKKEYGCKVYIHIADLSLHIDGSDMAAVFNENYNDFSADVVLHGGEIINECGLSFKVLHTPGHTPGGVCYICDKYIFSGDTLFLCSIGRSDFPKGSTADLVNSVRNVLFALDGEYIVLPGHGEETTLDFERRNNPYV